MWLTPCRLIEQIRVEEACSAEQGSIGRQAAICTLPAVSSVCKKTPHHTQCTHTSQKKIHANVHANRPACTKPQNPFNWIVFLQSSNCSPVKNAQVFWPWCQTASDQSSTVLLYNTAPLSQNTSAPDTGTANPNHSLLYTLCVQAHICALRE